LLVAQIDVFTDEAYAGNPAGVCLLPDERDDLWMSRVAREMNCANTAFVQPREDGFGLRWFTAGGVEVALCGHATLATAHLLYEQEHLAPDQAARFYTQSGLLTARRRGALIEMDFPLEIARDHEVPPALSQGLGVSPVWVGKNRLDFVVELEGERSLRALQPDLSALASLDARGIVVTARSDGEYDYVLRFFGPRVGVPEDMVTGTAHCALGPYWTDKLGKKEFTAYQASIRGGVVKVRLESERINIGGQAVTVLRGEWLA